MTNDTIPASKSQNQWNELLIQLLVFEDMADN